MAINFGQQINQALSGAIDRNQQGRVQAQQLAQRMQQQQFEQEMQQMVQNLREREFELAQEAQTEQMYQNVIENRLKERQEDRLQQQADQQGEYYQGLIENQKNRGGDDGVAPETLISGLQSLLNTSNRAFRDATRERQDVEGDLSTDLNEPARVREQFSRELNAEENDDVDTGLWDFAGVKPAQINEAEQRLQAAQQDSAAAAQQIQPLVDQEQSAAENVQNIQRTLQGLIARLGGGEPRQEPEQNTPEITSRSEFDDLEDGATFIAGGTQYRKEDGQAVPIQ